MYFIELDGEDLRYEFSYRTGYDHVTLDETTGVMEGVFTEN